MHEKISYNSEGLVPVVVQSSKNLRVLMMAWMNAESLEESIRIGETVFYSRSRKTRWHKGATSGNTQRILKIEVDCDSDCLLVTVEESGPACHNGTESCFDTKTIYQAS